MEPIARRKLMQGGAALAVAASAVTLPAVAFSMARRSDPVERVKQAVKELEQAMRAAYGGRIRVVGWGPHFPADTDDPANGSRAVMICTHPNEEGAAS
jgi:hypothetical protein